MSFLSREMLKYCEFSEKITDPSIVPNCLETLEFPNERKGVSPFQLIESFVTKVVLRKHGPVRWRFAVSVSASAWAFVRAHSIIPFISYDEVQHLEGFLRSWWFFSTHLKKYATVKFLSFPPRFRGENSQKYLSCHHPVSLTFIRNHQIYLPKMKFRHQHLEGFFL